MNRPWFDARGTAVRGTLLQALTTSTLTSDRSAVRMGTDVTQRPSVDTPALTLVQKPRAYVLMTPSCPPSRPGSPAWPHPPVVSAFAAVLEKLQAGNFGLARVLN